MRWPPSSLFALPASFVSISFETHWLFSHSWLLLHLSFRENYTKKIIFIFIFYDLAVYVCCFYSPFVYVQSVHCVLSTLLLFVIYFIHLYQFLFTDQSINYLLSNRYMLFCFFVSHSLYLIIRFIPSFFSVKFYCNA